jgi:hypothetical protein
MFGECVTEGSSCHHFSRIFEGTYSRVVAEFFCLCLRSFSDPLVGQDWALETLTGTLPLEGGLRSELTDGQRAYSLSLLEMNVWLVVEVEEHVAMLVLRKIGSVFAEDITW